MFDDLRQFLDKTRELGECKLIESADWDLEIGLISELQMSRPNQPLLLFDKIKGSKPGYRVATNAKEFPPSIKSSAEALAKTKEKWGKVLFGGT